MLLLGADALGLARQRAFAARRTENGDENGEDMGEGAVDFLCDSGFHLRFLSCVKLVFGLSGKSRSPLRGVRPSIFAKFAVKELTSYYSTY